MALQGKCKPCRRFYTWGDPYAPVDDPRHGDDSHKLTECVCPSCGLPLKRGSRTRGRDKPGTPFEVVKLEAPPLTQKDRPS